MIIKAGAMTEEQMALFEALMDCQSNEHTRGRK